MISKNFTYKIILFLIFSSVFLIELNIIGVPFTYIIFIIINILIVLNYKRLFNEGFFLKSRVKQIILFLILYSVIVLLLKYENVDILINNYKINTGTEVSFLYFKVSLSAFILLALSYASFSFGFSIKNNEVLISKIITLIINLTFLLALTNVIKWLITTGGVIDRYNFKPSIISSYGVITQWSNLGFLLLLSENKKHRFISLRTFKLLILATSIAIILSRSSQIIFLISVIIYFYFQIKKFAKFKLLLVIFGIILLILNLDFEFINFYTSLNSLENNVYRIRFESIIIAIEVFKNHMFFGAGTGMFSLYNTTTIIVERQAEHLASTHNGFFSILSETGVFGLLIHFSLIFVIIKGILIDVKTKIINNRYDFKLPILIFIISNIILLFTQNYFLFPPSSEFVYYGISITSWILIGLLSSYNKQII